MPAYSKPSQPTERPNMRTSQFLLSTLKETPSDAVVISHQLMLRAGMIRKLASGLYTWLPMGLRVLRKVENVVREEMNAAGALEVLMPAIQPAELWQESGRIRVSSSIYKFLNASKNTNSNSIFEQTYR